MPEKLQILYMQTRLVRLASEKWNKTIEETNKLFLQYNIYRYIADFWNLFHIEGDEAVLEDITNHMNSRGADIWSVN